MNEQIKDTPCGCDGSALCSWHQAKYEIVSTALDRRAWATNQEHLIDETFAARLTKAAG